MRRGCIFIAACLCLLLNFAVPPVFGDEVDNLYNKAAEKYHELYKDSPFRKQAENWLTTIKQFQLIYQNYPNHPQAPKALYNIGRLYRSLYQWNQEDIYLDRSNITFRTLVKNYPNSDLADDAQFLLGENYEIYKLDNDLAQIEYKKVVDQFPQGTATQKALVKLERFQSGQDVALEPNLEKAASPDDLSQPRYAGLSEQESNQTDPVMVTKVDYWSTVDWSRMVINVKGQVRYKYQLLAEDEKHSQKRLYIDLLNSYIPLLFKRTIAANDGLVAQARIAQFNRETVRVVLDLESLDKIKIFHFSLPNQYKIVIDIIGKSSVGTIEESPQQSVSYKSPITKIKDSQKLSLSKALGLKVKTIIIDPGHGGKDPGAIAFNIMEKDIVLDIAKYLKEIIHSRHPDIKVLLTRSTDKFIELEARTAFANQNKGDLFISIHVNASLKTDLSGVETYFLNLTTDNEALNLAAKENQTSLKSISDLQTILNDLMVNSKIKESRDLAEVVHASLVGVTEQSIHKMNNLGVKQAPFTVLIGAQMPSILVETGFLSNKIENSHLRKAEYMRTLATGICDGIKGYMN
jgi:N-acetylmuramoyl-L-alanine amidase